MVFNTQTCKYKGFSNHKGFTNGKVFANEKGFTIVELVIVIAVIGILAAVLIPTFNKIIEKANESKATQEVTNVVKELNLIHPNIDLDSLLVLYYERTEDKTLDIGFSVRLKYMFEFVNRELKFKTFDEYNIDGEKLTIGGKLYYKLDLELENPDIVIYSKSKEIEERPQDKGTYSLTIDKTSHAISNMEFSRYEKKWKPGDVIPIEFDSIGSGLLKVFVNDVFVETIELGSVNPVYNLTITDTDVIVKAYFCYEVSFTENAKTYFSFTTVNEVENTLYMTGDKISLSVKMNPTVDLNINETLVIKANDRVIREIKYNEDGSITLPIIVYEVEDTIVTIDAEILKDANIICYEDLYPFVNDFKTNDVSDIKEIIEIKDINYQNAYEYFSACYMDKSTVSGQLYIMDFIKHLKLSRFEICDAPSIDLTSYRKYVIVTETEVYELMYTDKAVSYNNEWYELKQTDKFGEMDHYYSYCVFSNINLKESSFYTVNIENKTSNVEIIDTLDLRRLIFTQNEDLVVYNPITNITFNFNGNTYRILNNKQFRNEVTNRVYDIVNNFSFENILSKVRPTYVTLSDKYDFIDSINKEDVKEIMYHQCREELINECEFITINPEEENIYLDYFLNYLRTNKFEYVENVGEFEPIAESYYSLILKDGTVYQIDSSNYIYINGDCYKTQISIPELPSALKQTGYTFARSDYENYKASFQTETQILPEEEETVIDIRSIIFDKKETHIRNESCRNKFVYEDIELYIVSLGDNNNDISLKTIINEEELYLEVVNGFNIDLYKDNSDKVKVSYLYDVYYSNAIPVIYVYYDDGYHLTEEDIYKMSGYGSNITYTIIGVEDVEIEFGDDNYIALNQDLIVRLNIPVDDTLSANYDVLRCMCEYGLSQNNQPANISDGPVEIKNMPTFVDPMLPIGEKLIYDKITFRDEYKHVTGIDPFQMNIVSENVFEYCVVLCKSKVGKSMYYEYKNFSFQNYSYTITELPTASSDNINVKTVDFVLIPRKDLDLSIVSIEIKPEIISAIEGEYGFEVSKLNLYNIIEGNYIVNPEFKKISTIRKNLSTRVINKCTFVFDYDILVYSKEKGLRPLTEAYTEGIYGLTKSMEYIAAVHYSYNPNFRRVLEKL